MSAGHRLTSTTVDLVSVRRCDRTFDALAARQDAPFDDPAVRLLAALTADVDTSLPASHGPIGAPADGYAKAEESGDPPLATIRILPSDRDGDGGGARTRVVAVRAALSACVAIAALTTTGVAAAKIGHLQPIGHVLGISEHTASPAPAEVAARQVRDALSTASHQLEEGRYAAARQTLRLAREDLAGVQGAEAAVLADAIERLEVELARATDEASSAEGREGPNHNPVPSPGIADPVASSPPSAGDRGGSGAGAGKADPADKARKAGGAAGDKADPAGNAGKAGKAADQAPDVPSEVGSDPPAVGGKPEQPEKSIEHGPRAELPRGPPAAPDGGPPRGSPGGKGDPPRGGGRGE